MRQILFVCSLLALSVNAVESDAFEAVCKGKTGFTVIENTVLTNVDSIVYEDLTEEECVKSCAENRDKFGREIFCSAFTYSPQDFTCSVYKEKSFPVGKAEVTSVIGKKYFEKACLDESVPAVCNNGLFIRVDDFVLAGYAVEVVLKDSLEECINYCAGNTTCKSAMFFYEEKECIVNTETAISHPEGFTKEDNDPVIYFQNACPFEQATEAPKNERPVEPVVETNFNNDSFDTVEGSGAEVEQPKEELTTPATTEEETLSEKIASVLEPETPKESQEEPVSAETASTISPEFTSSPEESDSFEESDEDEEDEREIESGSPSEDKTSKLNNMAKLNEKAVYLKYKKHPRNFAVQTFGSEHDESSPFDELSEEEEEEESSIEVVGKNTNDWKKRMKVKKVKQQKTILPVETEVPEEVNYFTEWSDWTPCQKAGERQIRRRQCINLKKCVGPLMEFQSCSSDAVVTTTQAPRIIQSVRSLVGVGGSRFDEPQADSQQSTFNPAPQQQGFWGPWMGKCQEFASGQPCNNGQMIGFESRECVAEDPAYCVGPFFRYCTISC